MLHTFIYRLIRKTLAGLFFIGLIPLCNAQKGPEKTWNSSRILHEIQKLKHVGRVLYIAAHPDDENTQLIAYLANVKGIDVAYMSLTRGDGGQDLIGPEVREELGVIRTQELLMARSVDGGQQFFSRANDFGFSKTAAETFHIWDSLQVLSDIVWKIRQFKPDIIITRFSPTYTKTHGHHQASAILAQEAFDDAANPAKFPEQLKYVSVWQAKSLFWNTSTFFFQDNKLDTAGLYYTNIGVYMPLLGVSIGEMAAESRTMHKSQGFGVSPRRGDIMEYFVYLKGEKPKDRDIFSVVHWDWNRIPKFEKITKDVDKIIKGFDLLHPENSIGSLIRLKVKLKKILSSFDKIEPSSLSLVKSKMNTIDDIILQCAGIYAEAINPTEFICPGDTLQTKLNIMVQNGRGQMIEDATLHIGDSETVWFGVGMTDLDKNSMFTSTVSNWPLGNDPHNLGPYQGIVPLLIPISGPYWLEQEHSTGMYSVTDKNLLGRPENPWQIYVTIEYRIFDKEGENIEIEKDIPVFSKTTDPIKGDVYSLARIVPPAVVIPEEKFLVFANDTTKEIHIKVKSFKKGKATVRLIPPGGWVINDTMYLRPERSIGTVVASGIEMKGDGKEQIISLKIRAPNDIAYDYIVLTIEMDGHTYSRSFEDINYDHIPEQILLPKSKIKVVRMDIVTHPKLIGYINGAGDEISASLEQIGYKVEMIAPAQIATTNLSKYDCIIAGVRAYNTIDRLKYDNAKLMEYVKNGGNYIVQYNNNFRLVTDSIGPYYLHPANVRTTEEDCKITFLNVNNPVLNYPNKITQKDFEGWVQERGLYYPDKWDTAHYTPILEMNDAGEAPTKGAILVAQYGKGNFVYTGLSFFRELPAGVPGAYRLMANLVELEKH